MNWTLALGDGGIRLAVVNGLRALYQLVLGLGGPGLFVLALADSSFLSVPEGNDVLIVVLSTGSTWRRMAYYVAMTTAGSVTGCAVLFLVGRRGGRFVERKLKPKRLEQARRLYERWGSFAIIIPSVLPPPTPFKVFVLSAGVFGLSFPRFLMSVLVGRSFRYSMWGVLALLYGEKAKDFLQTHSYRVGLAVLVLTALGVGLFLIIQVNRRRKVLGEKHL